MDELGIEKQKVTAEDQEEGGGGTGSGSAPSSGGMSDLDEIERLAELHTQGIPTDEELSAKKKQILGP